MSQPSSDIAILFFSRSAKAEAEHKQLTSSFHNQLNIKVAGSLIAHTEQKIRKTDLPYFTIDETKQIGNTFGERFTNAFLQLFEAGFDYVISVGNDTPKLRSQHIEDAARRLRSDVAEVVLGPDTDGGTWLMGYHRDAFNPAAFQQLPWNSADLLDTILQQFGDEKHINLLEKLSDIDDGRALTEFIHRNYLDLSLLQLARNIRSYLASNTCIIAAKQIAMHVSATFQYNQLRAPPIG